MQKQNQNGFTLIELLIVTAIIGIVAAIFVPGLLRSKEAKAASHMTMQEQVHAQRLEIVNEPAKVEDVIGEFEVVGFDLTIPGLRRVIFERLDAPGVERMPFSGVPADSTISVGDRVVAKRYTFNESFVGKTQDPLVVWKKP